MAVSSMKFSPDVSRYGAGLLSRRAEEPCGKGRPAACMQGHRVLWCKGLFRAAGFATAIFLSVSGGGEARADTPKLLGKNKDWSAYQAKIKEVDTCYALSQPQDQNPKNVRRSPVYFFITTQPKEGIRNQVTVEIGYPFDEKARAYIEVDGEKTFDLFTKGERAWIADPSKGRDLVAAMKAGEKMVVRGRSKRGTDTFDVYSLRGVTASIDMSDRSCR